MERNMAVEGDKDLGEGKGGVGTVEDGYTVVKG